MARRRAPPGYGSCGGRQGGGNREALELPLHGLRKPVRTAPGIGTHEGCTGASERRVIGRAGDPVREHDFAASEALHAGVNPDEFVVCDGDPVLDFDSGDREPQASALEFRVRHAMVPHE